MVNPVRVFFVLGGMPTCTEEAVGEKESSV